MSEQKTTPTSNPDGELNYQRGHRAAWLSVLATAIRELGVDDIAAGQSRWLVERTETIAALRFICEHYGDNDWDDDLHLADVIEKHLGRHLDD